MEVKWSETVVECMTPHESTCIFMHTRVRHDEIQEMMLGNI